MPDCIFCKITRGEIPTKKVFEDQQHIAFHDIKPKAPVHLLVVPKRHVERFSDYSDSDTAVIGELFQAARRVAKAQGLTDYRLGVNCGSGAGQEVLHMHVHLMGGWR